MAKRTYPILTVNVLWDSDLCVHCETCHIELPTVFQPTARPWVNVAGATEEQIIAQVGKCPSGALLIQSK